MVRTLVLAMAVSLGAMTLTAPSAHANPNLPSAPGQSAYDGIWHERHFVIALRARWFANSLERRGYLVQVQRVGLLHWCVRYRAV